jgi:monofunctional biosynthetic peptidoglycan transglycosylase
MSKRWLRVIVRIVEVGVVIACIPALLLWCSVPSTAKLVTENPRSTAFIDLRRTEAEAANRKFQLHWEWRPIGKISRYLRAAVIYAEDIHFYSHDGVDWSAMSDAVEKDFAGAKIGGSTITQQLAKNLYLSPNRSYIRKAREMLIAFSLEDHLTKTRILELYLNVVEWGDGVFGAEAAAKHWFGHSAQSLSPAEAARLAIALPNPIKRAPNVHTTELGQKAIRIINLLRMQGLIDASQYSSALAEFGARAPVSAPTPPATEPTQHPTTPPIDLPAPGTPSSPRTPAPPAPPPTDNPTTPPPTPPTNTPTTPAPPSPRRRHPRILRHP